RGLTAGFRPEPPDSAARWIGSAGSTSACFRRTFSLSDTPTRGILSITSPGSVTVWLNGERVGQATFDPLKRRVPAFDVARSLRQGETVLAVEVTGKAEPTLVAELHENSSVVFVRTLTSDATWKVSPRPEPGWQTQAFDDRSWQPAQLGRTVPDGQNLIWEAVLQDHFRYQADRIFPVPSGNQ